MLNQLQETLKPFRGKARHFLILRISGVKKQQALELAGGSVSDYNRWLIKPDFVEVHRNIQELFNEHRDDALRLLRKENQLNAAILERKLIDELTREVEERRYKLMRTGIARDLYTRLMSEMDKVPDVQVLSWEQRIQQNNLYSDETKQLPEGDSIPDAEYKEVDDG